MSRIDGFQTTDSFRFGCQVSSASSSASSISLASSASSSYGSRLSLSQTSSSHRRSGLKNYFREKISRHKSLASLLLLTSSPRTDVHGDETAEIYDDVWNLDAQIEKLRSTFQDDCKSTLSMSVDTPRPKRHCADEQELLSAAAWYQEGLPRPICEEYLMANAQPTGSFMIRRSYAEHRSPFVLSIKTNPTSIDHFPIDKCLGYQIRGASKSFINLSSLVIHHTVMSENLPVPLVLPQNRLTTCGLMRSVRF